MTRTARDPDLDKVDGRTIVAWLIYSGAGWFVGGTPWMLVDAVIEALYAPPTVFVPGDMQDMMRDALLDGLMPMLVTLVPCALVAGAVVLAERAGRRLPIWAMVLLGLLFGVVGAAFAAPPDILLQLVFAGCIAIGAGAMAVARRLLIRGG